MFLGDNSLRRGLVPLFPAVHEQIQTLLFSEDTPCQKRSNHTTHGAQRRRLAPLSHRRSRPWRGTDSARAAKDLHFIPSEP